LAAAGTLVYIGGVSANHYDFDPGGLRLPIKIDTTSNCEFEPRPLTPLQRAANAEARRRVDLVARRSGLVRRSFFESLPGAASVLLAFNDSDQPFDCFSSALTDRGSLSKRACLESPNPSFQTFGPKTRREFLSLHQPGRLAR
jgi:hypothetical protein